MELSLEYIDTITHDHDYICMHPKNIREYKIFLRQLWTDEEGWEGEIASKSIVTTKNGSRLIGWKNTPFIRYEEGVEDLIYVPSDNGITIFNPPKENLGIVWKPYLKVLILINNG